MPGHRFPAKNPPETHPSLKMVFMNRATFRRRLRAPSLAALALFAPPYALAQSGGAGIPVHSSVAAQTQAQPTAALGLQGVPLLRQTLNDCGPASIAMVLGYYGRNIPVADISRATKPSPSHYMQTAAISQYVQPLGFASTQFSGGNINHVRQLIALGVPVIALQYYRELGRLPHFRVVTGFDDRSRQFFIHDPAAGYVSVGYNDFDALWNTQGRTFVAVYPPAHHAAVMRALGVG